MFDYQTSLTALALSRRSVEATIAQLQAARDELAAAIIQPLDDLINAKRQQLAEAEAAIIAAARAEALATGNHKLHPNLRITHKTKSWKYDDKAVLERAEIEGLTGLIRVKKELNKVALNKALAAGDYPFLPVEEAPADVVVSIAPLGDLLIMAEVEHGR